VRFRTAITQKFFSGAIGAALAIAVALGLQSFRAGQGLVRLSYDVPFAFTPKFTSEEVILVLMDEEAHRNLGQSWGQQWDRSYHAKLLRKLTRDGAAQVIFDVWLADPGTKETDESLAKAIADHGKVVLAGVLGPMPKPGISQNQLQIGEGGKLFEPHEIFLNASTNWGISAIPVAEADLRIRQHYAETELHPSLPWTAAALAGANIVTNPAARFAERWLRYYGPPETIRSVSYHLALEKTNRYFQDKIVFIGGKPETRFVSEPIDEFPTPYTRWGHEKTAGVEIEATMFLNLLRGDWLNKLSRRKEQVLFMLCGVVFAFGLSLCRPLPGLGLALAAMVTVTALALLLFWMQGLWFGWMIIVAAQIPLAWGWSVLAYTKRLSTEKTELERKVATAQATVASERPIAWVPPAEGVRGEISIPDHALLRGIGKGSYGEVWLASNAIGIYRAIKIVRLDRFPDAVPYEREFKGMQKFMPISLSHPGMVHLLHVGRNEQAGYFYYIMELGDDQVSGQKIDPETYSSRNLAKDLQKRKRLPLDECVSLSLTLTDALEYLHQKRLVHRDIKPSNIIFVNGIPKFADIGLVTDLSGEGKDVTYIGTEGYIPPEGPGSPGADIYSLGKVIYEAGMGRDRRDFPELPDSLVEQADTVEFFDLNKIILKACEPDCRKRYQSAAEMRADFFRLQTRLHAEGSDKQA